jgi:hypothetical protein
MANEKYYGTMLSGGLYVPKEILEKYNARNNHNQFRIVCKGKSRAAAEKIMQDILEVTFKIFTPSYTQETGNEREIECCDKHIAIIALDNGYRDQYFSLQEIYDEIQEFRKNIK